MNGTNITAGVISGTKIHAENSLKDVLIILRNGAESPWFKAITSEFEGQELLNSANYRSLRTSLQSIQTLWKNYKEEEQKILEASVVKAVEIGNETNMLLPSLNLKCQYGSNRLRTVHYVWDGVVERFKQETMMMWSSMNAEGKKVFKQICIDKPSKRKLTAFLEKDEKFQLFVQASQQLEDLVKIITHLKKIELKAVMERMVHNKTDMKDEMIKILEYLELDVGKQIVVVGKQYMDERAQYPDISMQLFKDVETFCSLYSLQEEEAVFYQVVLGTFFEHGNWKQTTVKEDAECTKLECTMFFGDCDRRPPKVGRSVKFFFNDSNLSEDKLLMHVECSGGEVVEESKRIVMNKAFLRLDLDIKAKEGMQWKVDVFLGVDGVVCNSKTVHRKI